MENLLYDLWFEKRENSKKLYTEENQRIQSNLGMLRKTLNRYQRKLLLRIIDDHDLINEKTAKDNYASGFRTVTKIMIESLYYENMNL